MILSSIGRCQGLIYFLCAASLFLRMCLVRSCISWILTLLQTSCWVLLSENLTPDFLQQDGDAHSTTVAVPVSLGPSGMSKGRFFDGFFWRHGLKQLWRRVLSSFGIMASSHCGDVCCRAFHLSSFSSISLSHSHTGMPVRHCELMAFGRKP